MFDRLEMVRAVPECLARDMIRKKPTSSYGEDCSRARTNPEPSLSLQLTSSCGRRRASDECVFFKVFWIPSYLSKTFLKSQLSENVFLILLPGVLHLYPGIGTSQVVSHHLAKRPEAAWPGGMTPPSQYPCQGYRPPERT